jgi:hypothetical protein
MPGKVSQHVDLTGIREIAVAEKPDKDRFRTTVWNLLAPAGRIIAGIVSRTLGALRSSCEATAYFSLCVLVMIESDLSAGARPACRSRLTASGCQRSNGES